MYVGWAKWLTRLPYGKYSWWFESFSFCKTYLRWNERQNWEVSFQGWTRTTTQVIPRPAGEGQSPMKQKQRNRKKRNMQDWSIITRRVIGIKEPRRTKMETYKSWCHKKNLVMRINATLIACFKSRDNFSTLNELPFSVYLMAKLLCLWHQLLSFHMKSIWKYRKRSVSNIKCVKQKQGDTKIVQNQLEIQKEKM